MQSPTAITSSSTKWSNDRHPRVAIGPANYAGQATAWAEALRRHLGIEAWSFSHGHGFNFPTDRRIPSSTRSGGRTSIVDPAISAALRGSSHVYMDGFLPLSGGRFNRSLSRDLLELGEEGKALALICHGTDVRNPLSHLNRVPDSWWRTSGPRYLAQTAALSARNRRIINRFALPVFVSTPDLLHDVPGATWLPISIHMEADTSPSTVLDGHRRPRILHLPSRSKPPIKGTKTISAILRKLHDEALIERVEPTKMNHADFLKLIASVDVVIDQICSDSYGVTSVESMAAGRVTVSSVLTTRELIGMDIPIIDATPHTLEATLRRILKHPDRFRETAQLGPNFVRQVHNGEAAAAALRQSL